MDSKNIQYIEDFDAFKAPLSFDSNNLQIISNLY